MTPAPTTADAFARQTDAVLASVSRVIDGKPGERSDRDVFAMVEAWSRDRAFHELFDASREQAA